MGSPYRLRPVSTESLGGPCRVSHSTSIDKAIDNSHYPSHVGLRETLIVQQEGPHAHEVDIPPLQERTFLRCQRPVCLIKPSSSGHNSFSRAPCHSRTRARARCGSSPPWAGNQSSMYMKTVTEGRGRTNRRETDCWRNRERERPSSALLDSFACPQPSCHGHGHGGLLGRAWSWSRGREECEALPHGRPGR